MIQNNLINQNNQDLVLKEDKNNQIYTIVEIDNKKYAFRTKDVLEIIKLVELDYYNQMLSCVLGIVRYKQEPIGVLDLREIFKKDRITYDLSSKIVILKRENIKTAFICDSVTDIKKLDKEYIHPVPYEQNEDFYEGIYFFENENIYIINIQGIIDYISTNSQNYKSDDLRYIVDDEVSKKVLKDRKEALSNITNSMQSSISLYDIGVSFTINDVKYYINMASIKEFYKVKNAKFIKVPCTQDFIFGLINIKGDYITVLDIRNFYDKSKTTLKEKSTIIILNSEEYKVGILADEICESMNVDFDEIIQNKFHRQDESSMVEFVRNDEIYQVLDIEQLLKDERLTIC